MHMSVSEAINFDTHKFVKHLTENGFTEQQAEVLAEEQVNLLNSNLATKADIFALKADIETLRQETKTEIETLRQETKLSIAVLKTEIETLRLATQADIETSREKTRADVESIKSDLLKWIMRMMIAQGGVIVALVFALIQAVPVKS